MQRYEWRVFVVGRQHGSDDDEKIGDPPGFERRTYQACRFPLAQTLVGDVGVRHVIVAIRRVRIQCDHRVNWLAAVRAYFLEPGGYIEWAQVNTFEPDWVGLDDDGTLATVKLPAVKLAVKLIQVIEDRPHRGRHGSWWDVGQIGELLGVACEHRAELIELTHETTGGTRPVPAATHSESSLQLLEANQIRAHVVYEVIHISNAASGDGGKLLPDDVRDPGFLAIVILHVVLHLEKKPPPVVPDRRRAPAGLGSNQR